MEKYIGGWNRWTFLFVFLIVLTVTVADEDLRESDDKTLDLTTTNTSITVTEDVLENAETTNTSEMQSTEETTTHACQITADPGPCTAELIKFFYDSMAQRCRQFIYGGCDGNKNNFNTEAECLQTCTHNHIGDISQSLRETNDFPTDISPSNGDEHQMLTLANGHGETSFTFSAEYPFIQLKAVDISEFKLRFV